MKTIGIIGYGNFGAFVANWLSKDFEVRSFDKESSKVSEEHRGSLQDVCSADYVILAIPLSSYDTVLPQISTMLSEASIIVDVSSVKVKPIELIKKHLPAQAFIATHPLFGPETASDSVQGHTVVLCEANGVNPSDLVTLFQYSGLEVINMSADEHDQEMAVVQGLTFFLARGLNEFGLHKMKLKTPSFAKLLSLAELDKHHTSDLLETILKGNLYAEQVRKDFMKDIENFNDNLA